MLALSPCRTLPVPYLAMRQVQRHFVVILLLIAAALAQAPQTKPEPRLIDAEFHSKSLGRVMKYRVLLPTSYDRGNKRYPVLYLLHGLYGDYTNWTANSAIRQYAAALDVITAMPDANDSWYTNSATDPQQKYEDYLIKDFLTEIETRYRTTATRDTRFIAGLSMGGYGAIKFALKYPQLFAIAGSFSGAFDAPLRLDQAQPNFSQQLMKVFGPTNSKTRTENDIYELIKQANPDALPYLYMDCGTSDYFLGPDRAFTKGLSDLKIRYEYRERPGKHDWVFWDRAINMFLHEQLADKIH
jgi:putative tributyrin esterase